MSGHVASGAEEVASPLLHRSTNMPTRKALQHCSPRQLIESEDGTFRTSVFYSILDRSFVPITLIPIVTDLNDELFSASMTIS
jgi:hypothetical protein